MLILYNLQSRKLPKVSGTLFALVAAGHGIMKTTFLITAMVGIENHWQGKEDLLKRRRSLFLQRKRKAFCDQPASLT